MKAVGKALIFSTLAGLSMASQAYTVTDTYVGGDDHGHGDVIGRTDLFDITGADVSFSGTNVTVDIYTNFANTSAIGSYPSLTHNGLGIGVGDLFLSNSYSPNGSASNGYLSDSAANGNLWTYGLAIDDAYSEVGGSASLYALSGTTNDANAELSQDYLKAGVYRTGQEVAVDEASQTTSVVNTTGSWSVDLTAKKISFSFDAAGTNLFDSGDLAFHWAMLCGNDVIEGVVDAPAQVSEPSVLALFGLGLFGLGLARRRA